MKTVICDIDGTVSNSNWRLHFLDPYPRKDYEAFHSRCRGDTVIEPVQRLVRALSTYNHLVVMLTGRPETYRDITEAWLDENDVPYDALYMRPVGNKQSAPMFKSDVLLELRNHGHDVVLAIEDQQDVADMWRANGIHCLQTQVVV